VSKKQIDPKVVEALKKHGFGPDAAWDCHGTWVIYHRVLEQIAAKAGIKFEAPLVLEADGAHKVAAICVTGRMGDASEWSIGEAAPANNKNAYPFAMAEKRAKDRVVLKLIGIHGLAYSEDEADDFKKSAPPELPVTLLDVARAEAAKGVDAYKAWYLDRSIQERGELSDHHAGLKSAALAASTQQGKAA